jgi:hypothetical protein
MRLHSTIFVIAIFFFVIPAHAAGHVLTLVNDSNSIITSVSYSPPGTNRWFVMTGGPVDAGGQSRTRIAMPPSACVFDFRVRFEGHPTQNIRAWNVCRGQAVRVGTDAPPAGQP